MRRWLDNWLARHRHPASLGLHAVGVPLLVLAGGVAVWQLVQGRWDLWYRPVVLVVVSYALQWLGHKIEGNEMGEVVLIKKLLGRPYVAIAPRLGDAESEAGESGGSGEVESAKDDPVDESGR